MNNRLKYYKDTSLFFNEMKIPFELESGKYIICTSSKWMIYNSKNPVAKKLVRQVRKQLTQDQKSLRHKSRRILISVFDYFMNRVYSNNRINNQNGSVGIIMSTNRGLVGIDQLNSQMIVLCDNDEIYNKQENTFNHFSSYFTMPKQLFTNDNVIIEEFVSSLGPKISLDNIKKIISDYSAYFIQETGVPSSLSDVNDLTTITYPPLRSLLEKILKNERGNFEHYYTHGDLDIQNIIISSGMEVVLIDWEMATTNYFFCDIINLLVSSYMLTGNLEIINWYFEGKFDKELHLLFRSAGAEFKENNKRLYIAYYFKVLVENESIISDEKKLYETLSSILRVQITVREKFDIKK